MTEIVIGHERQTGTTIKAGDIGVGQYFYRRYSGRDVLAVRIYSDNDRAVKVVAVGEPRTTWSHTPDVEIKGYRPVKRVVITTIEEDEE